MGRVCREINDWIEEQVERPVEQWISQLERTCAEQDCNWWCLCCNKWLCWLAWVVVRVVTWVLVTVGKWVVRTVCEIVTFVIDVTLGTLKVIWGILSLNPVLIKEGFDDVVSTSFGTAILILGSIIGFVQTILGVQKPGRKLTESEEQNLRRIFRISVTYNQVRLVEGKAGVFSLNNRPFVLGNTIYLKDANVTTNFKVLVHECTHIWQFQNLGARYLTDAISAQWFLPGQGYSWEGEIARGQDQWVSFNKEAQAAFIEAVYLRGELVIGGVVQTPMGNGVFYDADGEKSVGRFLDVDHTSRANNAVVVVRRGG